MKINEGNIFEAMRLVLPEHRNIMKGWQQQRNVKKPPTLSEHELGNMQFTISEAIQNELGVRVTVYGELDDMTLEGFLVYGTRLKVRTDAGIQTVDVKRLIKVEIL